MYRYRFILGVMVADIVSERDGVILLLANEQKHSCPNIFGYPWLHSSQLQQLYR
jgi:hypothetical protein